MVVEGGEGEVGILAAVMGQLTLCSSAIEAALQRPRVDCSGSTCIALARKARSLGPPLQHTALVGCGSHAVLGSIALLSEQCRIRQMSSLFGAKGASRRRVSR